MTSTDSNFITNEGDKKLVDRFIKLINDTRYFDCLVGYFFVSGFYELYKALEKTERIRILIGISTNKETYDLIEKSNSDQKAKEEATEQLKEDMANSEETIDVEEGVRKFVQWLIPRSDGTRKLEIKVYPRRRIHAKLYIMTFKEGDRDHGHVVTGSSNFTKSGLKENIEFNVQLYGDENYNFAFQKFEELWGDSVPLSDEFKETLHKKTWFNSQLTPYEIYLKFLYEYFREKINLDKEDINSFRQEGILDLEYQREAVKDAKAKLEAYNGVFISDVVGLGKTYITAMLIKQIGGRTLVIAPPALLDKENPGSWQNIFLDFWIPFECLSIGQLDKATNLEKYDNIVIDESHRFRTETNITYDKLKNICNGKKVILVSATPLNNSPRDILSQIKLFQKSKESTIPNVRDLDHFFNKLERNLKQLERHSEEYFEEVKKNSKEIRNKILKHVMVRRTRKDIEKYFGEDIKKRGLSFPEVMDPKPAFYEFNDTEDSIFTETAELISKKFKYARYTPLSRKYYKGAISQREEQGQRNMRVFMKILLIKRLESSFYAFRKSIDRFIYYYRKFIDQYNKGTVFISKRYINKIFEYIDSDDDEAIDNLIQSGKGESYSSNLFKEEFIRDMNEDLELLLHIQNSWKNITRDPKLLKLNELLSSDDVLKKGKVILFTESKETAQYLAKNLESNTSGGVLLFTGGASKKAKIAVIDNFDPKASQPKNDCRVLITTDVLSEGVNLHRSNVVFNYDIPWNPTKLMQRVGRINRINTTFKKIYTFNFFPTKQSNDIIKLKEVAESKIRYFIDTLGADAKYLTDNEEIKSHDLFSRLLSKKSIVNEEEEDSELKYLQIIRKVRDENQELFENIQNLPQKARTGRLYGCKANNTLTYFRKGNLHKFFQSDGKETRELDFLDSVKILETNTEDKSVTIKSDFYSHLDKNKEQFRFATSDLSEIELRGGRDRTTALIRILKSKQVKECLTYTLEDHKFVRDVTAIILKGNLSNYRLKVLVRELKNIKDPTIILQKLREIIKDRDFIEPRSSIALKKNEPSKIIISEYLVPKNG